MWEKIKNFFKWIADHTGISWIARKISSGWKWLFGGKANATQQNTSQQGKFSDETLPKTLDSKVKPKQSVVADGQTHSNGADSRTDVTQSKEHDEPPVIGGIYENTNGVLEIFVIINHTGKVFGGGVGLKGKIDHNYNEIIDNLKVYTLYVECEKGEVFQITCNKLTGTNKNGAFLSIESVASQDGKTSSDELATTKQMLDLSEKQAIVAVTQISKNPITVPKSEIASSATTPAASNGQLVSA